MPRTASIIAFTRKGEEISKRVECILKSEGYEINVSIGRGESKVNLSKWAKESFCSSDVMVFVGATGIAVRAIAPYVKSKITDPAVIVIDDNGDFCIPLLSGHVGGANKVSNLISERLGATAVITTATDINGVFAIDTFAKENDMAILNPSKIKNVSSKLLNGEIVKLYSDFPVDGCLPNGIEISNDKNADVIITYKNNDYGHALVLAPKVLSVGIGCRKNTDEQSILNAFNTVFNNEKLLSQAVYGVFSIDLKAEEQGLIDFCKSIGVDFSTFKSAQLLKVEGEFSSSSFVKSVTGVDNICERSAVLGSQGTLMCKKYALNGVTVAIATKDYRLRF